MVSDLTGHPEKQCTPMVTPQGIFSGYKLRAYFRRLGVIDRGEMEDMVSL